MGCFNSQEAGQSVSPTLKPTGTQVLDGTLLKSSLCRDTTPDATPADLAQIVIGNNTFAWDMYSQLRSQDTGNIFYSPYSISVALAMTYAGTRTQTAEEMAKALHFILDQNYLHAAFNALDIALMSRGKGAQGREGQGFTLRIANSLWGEKTYTFLQSYLDQIALNYGGGMRLLDFVNQPEQCRLTINDWVSSETKEKIQDLIPQGIIDPLTRMVLVNAVYFDAAWADTFVQSATRPQFFFLANGDSISHDFMHKSSHLKFSQGTNYQAVELLYDGGDISMVLVEPKNGTLADTKGLMNRESIDALVAGMKDTLVRLSLPKFTFKYGTTSLKTALKSMGILQAFGDADFSGIDGTRNLYIADVLHQAFVAVDEKGTTAAAATAVVISRLSALPQPEIIVTLDHPFLFFIRDVATGHVLFIGRVMTPVKG